jgi:hypothetical protein
MRPFPQVPRHDVERSHEAMQLALPRQEFLQLSHADTQRA